MQGPEPEAMTEAPGTGSCTPLWGKKEDKTFTQWLPALLNSIQIMIRNTEEENACSSRSRQFRNNCNTLSGVLIMHPFTFYCLILDRLQHVGPHSRVVIAKRQNGVRPP